MRHAKSSWKNPELNDFDRPLNKRGKRDAPFMGKLLKGKKIKPDLVITSPAERAYTTAKYFAEEMNYPAEKIRTDNSLYEANSRDIIKVMTNTEDNINSLMIFAHNPGITDLHNFICEKHIDNIPTSAVVSLILKVRHWKEVAENTCQLEFFEYPKNYLK